MSVDPEIFIFLSVTFFHMLLRAQPKTFWCPPQIKEKYNANIRHSIFIMYVSGFKHCCILKYLILVTALIFSVWHLVESQP